MSKVRGFEPVADAHKQYTEKITPKNGKVIEIFEETQLPVRGDKRSAGYDFYMPVDTTILPMQKTIVWSNVKAYMQDDEVLKIYPRSSVAHKLGIWLSNTVAIIDASHYENPDNDGNIGLALINTTGKAVTFKRGERVAQGIFSKYLIADEDNSLREERGAGFGSSGK